MKLRNLNRRSDAPFYEAVIEQADGTIVVYPWPKSSISVKEVEGLYAEGVIRRVVNEEIDKRAAR